MTTTADMLRDRIYDFIDDQTKEAEDFDDLCAIEAGVEELFDDIETVLQYCRYRQSERMANVKVTAEC